MDRQIADDGELAFATCRQRIDEKQSNSVEAYQSCMRA